MNAGYFNEFNQPISEQTAQFATNYG